MSYTVSEQELYGFRYKNIVLAQKIIDITKTLVKSFNEDIDIPTNNDIIGVKDDLEQFVDKVISDLNQRVYYKSDLSLLDPRFLYPYNPKQGFSIAFDAFYQPPNPGFYQVVMTMNPPAAQEMIN